MIKNLSTIDTNRHEGRLLMAALTKLTVENHPDKTPEEVIELLNDHAGKMFSTPLPEDEIYVKPIFPKALTDLINSYSLENHSDTPDFILAEYMCDCLMAFNRATNDRERWYGRKQPHPQAEAI